MKPQITIPQWLALPSAYRLKIAEVFSVPKSEGVHVEKFGEEAHVVCDGHTHADLSVIDSKELSLFIEKEIPEGDPFAVFFSLWSEMVQVIAREVEGVAPSVDPSAPAGGTTPPAAKEYKTYACGCRKGFPHEKGCAKA